VWFSWSSSLFCMVRILCVDCAYCLFVICLVHFFQFFPFAILPHDPPSSLLPGPFCVYVIIYIYIFVSFLCDFPGPPLSCFLEGTHITFYLARIILLYLWFVWSIYCSYFCFDFLPLWIFPSTLRCISKLSLAWICSFVIFPVHLFPFSYFLRAG